MEHTEGIIGRNVRPINDLYCATSISNVPPVLAHHQRCPIPFPPTEIFGCERIISRLPVGMKWNRIGWNYWRLQLSCRTAIVISTVCDCGGVWDRKKIHCRTGVCTRGHQLCYFPSSVSRPCRLSHPRPPLLSCRCPPP